MLPDLESLRCFEALARQLNFRAAASEVGLSPAAFSDRLRRLEDELGARLVERNTRRTALTEAGLKMLPQARRVLAEARRCAESVRGTSADVPYTIRLGTRFELGLSWIVPALAPLERVRPARHLDLVFGNGPELLRQLEQGHVDGVVTSARLTLAGITYRPLHEEQYAFVASARLLRRESLRTAADAARHTLFDLAADLPLFRYFADAAGPREHWAFARLQLLGTTAAVRARVLEGAGVAVLPEYLVRKDLAARRLVRVAPRVKLPADWFRLVWRDGHPLATELAALASELAKMPLR